ncbi:PIN domain-containing protein [Natronolimnohabitans innermongolicus]|uniref:Ribonuclease VapC n=1 Tax=Natronolimnohabitans innermongolicus JCM 12255 TaxID=1227499 RepID=L9WQJ8_9EURY|nr:PIN domain-containing protein [Natronolimnohabitans innermongolicus]ELY51667.1 twitching motility protein PilT [Natronolimnohabitans innermongolicus JCM 12255]
MACLDTPFLIDLLNGTDAAAETMTDLDDQGTRHAVSPVTAAELWIGANLGSVQEFRRTEELLESLLWLEITRSCARRAGRIQAELIESGSELGFNDCLIAATAIEHGEPLVTGASDFERVPDLRIRTY